MSHKLMPRALYFDSNVLRRSGWPDPSAQLLETIETASSLGVGPAMVELVLQELTEGWIREVVDARRLLTERIRAYSRRACGLGETSEPPLLPEDSAMRAHVAKVTGKIVARFRTVQTSKQPTEYYTRLAMSRGGAFVEGGKGFNDTVILVSLIDDMVAHGFESAIFVSGDQGFQNVGITQVTRGKHLQIVRSIEELEKIFDDLRSAKLNAYLKEKKEELLAAVKSHQAELVVLLRQNLPLTNEDLKLDGRVRKVEFLELLSYDDAHGVPFVWGKDSLEANRLSVDVRIRVRAETENILFERRSERFDASPLVLYPEDVLIASVDKEIVVTVEGTAEVSEGVITLVRFGSIRSKSRNRGLGDLLID